jgi:hypothetical protein
MGVSKLTCAFSKRLGIIKVVNSGKNIFFVHLRDLHAKVSLGYGHPLVSPNAKFCLRVSIPLLHLQSLRIFRGIGCSLLLIHQKYQPLFTSHESDLHSDLNDYCRYPVYTSLWQRQLAVVTISPQSPKTEDEGDLR